MKFLTTISLLALLTASSPAIAAPPATTQSAPSNTRYSTRMLRVTWHGLEPDDPLYVAPAMTDLMNRLAPTVLGGTVNEQGWVTVNPIVRANSMDLDIEVDLPEGVRPAAKELVEQAINETEQSIVQRFDRRFNEEQEPRQDAAARAEQRVRDSERQAAELRSKMRQLAGRADISGKTITDAMTRLEEEKQKLELDQMAKSARRDELEKQIAEQSEKIQKKIESDPIAAELQKVVDARAEKADFANKQAGAGTVSMSEARDAVAQLAEARARLLERKRDAAAEAGGDVLAALNKELLTLSVDLRELQVRLKFVEAHLPGLRDAMDQLDAWERAEAQLQQARTELAKASEELHTLSRQGGGIRPPTFEILQSTDRESKPAEGSLFGGGGGKK